VLHIYRLADSGTAVTVTSVDDLRTALLITPAQLSGYDWAVMSSDSSILSKTKTTTGPDPVNLSGTDRLDYWAVVGSGTAVLTGQLLPKTGGGAAIATFKLTVTVTCSGVGVPAPAPPVQGQSGTLLMPGKQYNVAVYGQFAATVPSVASAQAVLDAALGAGAVTVTAVGQPSSGHPPVVSPDAVALTVTANKQVTLTNKQAISAAGFALPSLGVKLTYSVTVVPV